MTFKEQFSRDLETEGESTRGMFMSKKLFARSRFRDALILNKYVKYKKKDNQGRKTELKKGDESI